MQNFDKYVFNTQETILYRFPTHTNELVMDRSDAITSEVFMVVLEPGEAPPLHVHHDTEQVFYVLEGKGELYVGEERQQRFPVGVGDVGHDLPLALVAEKPVHRPET